MLNILEKKAVFELVEAIKKSDDLPDELPLRVDFRADLAFPSGMPIRLFAHAVGCDTNKRYVIRCRSGPYESCEVEDATFDSAVNKALLNLIVQKFFNVKEDI